MKDKITGMTWEEKNIFFPKFNIKKNLLSDYEERGKIFLLKKYNNISLADLILSDFFFIYFLYLL